MDIKWIRLLWILAAVIGILSLTSCSGQESRNSDFMSTAIQEDNSNTDDFASYDEETQKELWYSVGVKCKELSTVPGIDDPVILVNGLQITKRTVEFQKALQILPNSKPLKDEIISIVRSKVVQSEAIKRGIQPSQESIDAYLEQNLDVLKNEASGSAPILAYIEGMGMTIEEYMETQEELAYNMYQRSALWLSVKATQESYDKFVDELVEKADIEILDSEIKSLFPNN